MKKALVILGIILLALACKSPKLESTWRLEMLMAEHAYDSCVVTFDLAESKIYGYDGCNHFRGKIDSLGETTLRLGPIASTRKHCFQTISPDLVHYSLNKTAWYEVKKDELYLYNKNGDCLMKLKRQ